MCILYGMMHCIILIEYSYIVNIIGVILDHFDSNLRITIVIIIADYLATYI